MPQVVSVPYKDTALYAVVFGFGLEGVRLSASLPKSVHVDASDHRTPTALSSFVSCCRDESDRPNIFTARDGIEVDTKAFNEPVGLCEPHHQLCDLFFSNRDGTSLHSKLWNKLERCFLEDGFQLSEHEDKIPKKEVRFGLHILC